jgi:hypothetical protein
MPLSLTKDEARIFRISHVDNVPWILDNGLHSANGRPDPQYRSIGNEDLIKRRSGRTIPVPPGGVLSDYVPFYFTPFSIMMFNIKTGYGVKHVPNDDVVIFVSSLPRIVAAGVQFVFTNQHAYPPMAEYFADLAQLDRIDWALLQSRGFRHDPDDPGKKERYQAEALLWKHAPLGALDGVCCHSRAVEQKIRAEIEQRSLNFKVGAQPGWYF